MDFRYIFKRINLPGRLVSAPSTLTVGAMKRHYSKRTQSEETKHDLELTFVRGISGRTFDLPFLLREAFCVFDPFCICKPSPCGSRLLKTDWGRCAWCEGARGLPHGMRQPTRLKDRVATSRETVSCYTCHASQSCRAAEPRVTGTRVGLTQPPTLGGVYPLAE